MSVGTGILLAVALVVVLLVVLGLLYNRLVVFRNRFQNAYAQIDVQLKRRHDLIPNLVEMVKGYMAHERQTLEAVVAARSAAIDANARAATNPADAGAVQTASTSEGNLSSALGRLLVVGEAYPSLRADAQVGRLVEELTSTENRIAFARQAFNDAVAAYNTARQSVPTTFVAGPFGFGPAALFEVRDPEQREPVSVSFDAAAVRG